VQQTKQGTRGSRWRAGPARFPRARSVVRSHPPAPVTRPTDPGAEAVLLGLLRPRVASSSGPAPAAASPPCLPVLPALLPARAPPPPEKKFPNSAPSRASGSVLIEVRPLESALDSSPVSSPEPACSIFRFYRGNLGVGGSLIFCFPAGWVDLDSVCACL
jgi:hypothetical protein